MDRETSPKPPMCRGGCGFYGSAATEGLCSLCYKKFLKRQQESIARNAAPKSPKSPSLNSNKSTGSCPSNNSKSSATAESDVYNASDHSNSKRSSNPNPNDLGGSEPGGSFPSTSATVPAPAVEEDHDKPPEAELKEKKNRCAECGKKVGLTGFTCRCGGLYCPIHRYSDRHNCTFDYRELGAEEIRRNNPAVTAEKIRKI